MKVNYKFKTKPFKHQIDALRACTGKKHFGFFMEMGTGKSKFLIDDIVRLHIEKEIHFALIIAPKGVYRNWTEKEIPQQIAALSAEQNQLLGYKQALSDCCEDGECNGSKEKVNEEKNIESE